MRLVARLMIVAAFAAAGFAAPAAAQATRSVCDLEGQGQAKLLGVQKLYADNEEVGDAYYEFVGDISDSCGPKIASAIRNEKELYDFVFAEVTTFSHRAYLVSKGYPIDQLDRALDLACNAAKLPSDREIPREGQQLLDRSLETSGIALGKLNEYDISAVFTYVIAAADRARRGGKLGLTPKCGTT